MTPRQFPALPTASLPVGCLFYGKHDACQTSRKTKSKAFFFEKKKQKTFIHMAPLSLQLRSP